MAMDGTVVGRDERDGETRQERKTTGYPYSHGHRTTKLPVVGREERMLV